MKFTKEQGEGLSRFLDTIAASALIGAVVGATGHSALSTVEIFGLIFLCPLLLSMSFYLRRPK
jgi:hypothetical protein